MNPVKCSGCGLDRGILPTGILICPRCDCVPNREIPNAHLIKDVFPKS